MDSGFSIGGSSGVSVNTRTDFISRPADTRPVTTELPSSRTVEAAGSSQAPSADQRRAALATPPVDPASLIEQKISFDEATHTVVYSVVDKTDGYVINQFPDKAVLRQRAYFRQMDDAALVAKTGKLA